ncbi:MAG: TonB-dependent siderophore receptor [Pseudomonadota bacterium]
MPRKIVRPGLILVLLSVATIALPFVTVDRAFAQQSIELDGIIIQGQAPNTTSSSEATPQSSSSGTSEFNGVVAPASEIGAKTSIPPSLIPQAVSIIGQEEIAARGARKIDEALSYTAGVFAQPFGSDSDTNWYYIRGFDATQTGDYLDGLQVQAFAFGDFFIDPFSLGRIDVLKGPASVLYGGSNPGGIVNAISKRPTGRRLRHLEAGADEYGTAYVGLDVGDRLSAFSAYRLTAKIEGGDGYTNFEDGFRGFVAPSISVRPSSNFLFTVLTNYTHLDERHGGGDFLPYVGSVTAAPFGFIDRQFNTSEPDLDRYDRRQGHIGYEAKYIAASNLLFTSSARFMRASVKEQQLFAFGYDTTNTDELSRINFSHDTDATSFTTDNRVEGTVVTAGISHKLLFGVETKYYRNDEIQASALFGTTPSISPVNPIYGLITTSPVSYLNQDLRQRQVGVYAQDQLRFGGGFIVTVNGRYDWVRVTADNGPTFFAPTQNTSNEDQFREASGRAGLAYEFANGLTPYASVATFFNPIIGTDAAGDFFKPETGHQFEFGMKYAPKFMDALFTLSFFDTTRENVPVTDPTNIFAQVQRGEVNSRGVEFEGKAQVMRNLWFTAAVTGFDLEITKDSNAALVGKRPTIVPEFQASAFVNYEFDETTVLDGISIGAGVRHRGKSFADAENTLEVPEVTLVDLKLGYNQENWGVQFNVSNLFDKRYVAACQTALSCSYGEARRAQVKVTTKW